MMTNATYIDLLNKPACTLTALEQYFVNKYCDENREKVEAMFLDSHPGTRALPEHPQEQTIEKPAKKMARGIKGLADELGVCAATAQKIKNSGVIDKAISQQGRVILIDMDKAMQLMSADPWARKQVRR